MTNLKAEISYTDKGAGQCLVLIHGFCENKEIWSSLQNSIDHHYRVICPDIPGFGDSPLAGEEITIEYYASQIFNLLQALNIKKATIAGHSLGGYIALAFAEKYPAFLEGLVLFHSSAFEDTSEKKNNRDKVSEFVKNNGSHAFVSTLIPSLFTPANREKLKKEVLALTQSAALTPEAGIIAASQAMKKRVDRSHVLSKITVPVLYIIGKEDQVIPLDASLKQCHLAPYATAVFLSHTAHMGMIEQPEKALNVLIAFMELCGRNQIQ